MKNYIAFIFSLLLIVMAMASCKDKEREQPWQPDFIKSNLPSTLSIDGGQEFELFIADSREGERYN